MSWFRKKGKYWYFCYRDNGKEVQQYIGDDEAVRRKLLPKNKAVARKGSKKR